MEFQHSTDHSHWSDYMLDSNFSTPVLEKATLFPVRSISGANSFESDEDRHYILTALNEALSRDSKSRFSYQDRYCSSEEELSPMEEDDRSDASSFHSFDLEEVDEQAIASARASPSYDAVVTAVKTATTVLIVNAGPSNLIDIVPTPSHSTATSPTFAAMPSSDWSQQGLSTEQSPSTLPADADNLSQDWSSERSSVERDMPRSVTRSRTPSPIRETYNILSSTDSRSDRRRSTTIAGNPALSPSRFSLARRSSLFEATHGNGGSSKRPDADTLSVDTTGHRRFKSLHRLGLFKSGNKRESKDASGQAGEMPSPASIQRYQTPPPAPSMFAPSPSVRPLAGRVVARPADERLSTNEMAAAFRHTRIVSHESAAAANLRDAETPNEAEEQRQRAEAAAARARRLVSMSTANSNSNVNSRSKKHDT